MSGRVIWLTGLSGSGKSAVADGVKRLHPDFVIARMDDIRKVVTPEPSYSDTEREIVYRALVYFAKTLAELGHNVLIDATGNMRRWRELARALLPDFSEVYLKCPLELCATREASRKELRGAPEKIYEKGKEGWPVPGIQAPYEEPLNPELVIETDRVPLDEAIAAVDEFIRRKQGQ